MNVATPTVSPLRQRMIDDKKMQNQIIQPPKAQWMLVLEQS
jgi:hypothetical protein